MAKRIRPQRIVRKETTKKRIATVRRLRKEGLYIKEIMDEMNLSINTVKRYVHLANEPRGKRKDKNVKETRKNKHPFDPRQRHFTSKTQLFETFARHCKIQLGDLRNHIISVSMENIENIMGELSIIFTGGFFILQFVDDAHERGDHTGYRSLNAAFIRGMMLRENIDAGIMVDDFYTLKSSVKNDNWERKQVITYYYVLHKAA